MTTTINASTSAGLVNTADTSGVLALQTAGTTAVTVDASQNVGIGTTSPASYGKLAVVSSTAGAAKISIQDTSGGSASSLLQFGINDTSGFNTSDASRVWTTAASSTVASLNFAAYNGGAPSTAQMVLTGGNVGIGTSSPSNKLDVFRSTFGGSNTSLILSSVNSASAKINFAGIGYTVDQGSAGIEAASMYFSTYGSGALTERMRLTSAGDLLVGTTTSSNPPSQGISLFGSLSNAQLAVGHATGTGGGQYYCVFGYAGTTIGGIVQNGTANVQFNTSSDYRLKEDIAPMTGALNKVAQLKPVTFKWKSDGADGQGFIAHELQAVVPDCVAGEKDGMEVYMDDDGNEQTRPAHQGVDTSFLVATLTAAIQEQQALITQLQADVAALKGATP